MVDMEKKIAALNKKYGHNSASLGTFVRPTNVIPTGVLALDYALGTGGWPSGSIIEIYGKEDIGKGVLALYGVREAQKLGKYCAWVAAEPGYSATWAQMFGVDLERIAVGWPDDGKEAFDMLQDFVLDDDIEFIVFDSIGALLRPTETEVDKQMAQGGQAGLITWGVKRAWMAAYKRDKYLLFLNQVRDVMGARVPMVDSPGGHALKHASEIRVHLRSGEGKYTIKEDGDDVQVGHQVIAQIKRTKRDQGTNKRAVYDMYTKETSLLLDKDGEPLYDYPFGIDRVTDVINTGKRLGIITSAGAWLYYPDFPDGKLNGKNAVATWLKENPEQIDKIRTKVVEAIR